ncbi:MAG: thermonuclease family protein [Hyphomonadaceae bacterium]|nr:thermonuclease family protein [Hyphomonadaceae bacterium]
MKTYFITAAIFGFISSLSAPLGSLVADQGVLIGKVYVTDGDSMRMGDHRIRLFGIDAVEARQTCEFESGPWDCGRAARRALERLTDGKTLTCSVRDMDRGRHVAVCTADGVEINAQMVRRGWAVAYTDFSEDYVDEEAVARAEGLALWRSNFERPHDYRARLRAEQASAAEAQEPPSSDCSIKGNISRSGTKIFHEPGQRDYSRTRINEAGGERWFCSPEEARSEGWRRAAR